MPGQFYYVILDTQIVGRYGTDLDDALKHLKLYGTSKGPNRALIHILKGKAQHPHSLRETREYSHWENDEILENMQRVAEREYNIMMPFDQSHLSPASFTSLVSLPCHGSREDIREACHRYFESLSQDLAKVNKRTVQTTDEERVTDDVRITKRRRVSIGHEGNQDD